MFLHSFFFVYSSYIFGCAHVNRLKLEWDKQASLRHKQLEAQVDTHVIVIRSKQATTGYVP